MYKDKAKQRQANKERQKRHRALRKGIALPKDVIESINRLSDTPEEITIRTANALRYQRLYPSSFSRGIGGRKLKVPDGGLHHVSKPGDSDYKPSGIVEPCRYCSKPLPQLEQPRQQPGACLDCVMVKWMAA